MLTLLRRDSHFIWPYLCGILIIPVLLYLIRLPAVPLSTYIIFLYLFLGAPFYYEKMKHLDRFMISLPIGKRKIVLARYINLIVAVIVGTILILWFEATFYDNAAAKSVIVTSVIFTLIFAIISVALPVFYFFEKLWEAILCQVLIFIAGNVIFFIIVFSSLFDPPVHFILTIVDWNPTIVLMLFSFASLWISYNFSCRIYQKKDH